MGIFSKIIKYNVGCTIPCTSIMKKDEITCEMPPKISRGLGREKVSFARGGVSVRVSH